MELSGVKSVHVTHLLYDIVQSDKKPIIIVYARADIPLETVAVFQINVSFTTWSLTHSCRLVRLKGAFAQFANPPSSASF